jgi:hypothetical protein
VMPPNAWVDEIDEEPTTSFTLPINSASPDRGLSIDVLTLKWQVTPIFCISSSEGPHLLSDNHSSTPSRWPLEIYFSKDAVSPVDLERSRSGARISEILSSDNITFPTHAVYRSGALRPPTSLVRVGTELMIQTQSMHWQPLTSTSPDLDRVTASPATNQLPPVEPQGVSLPFVKLPQADFKHSLVSYINARPLSFSVLHL